MKAILLSVILGFNAAPGWTTPTQFAYMYGNYPTHYSVAFAAGHVYTAESDDFVYGPGLLYTTKVGTEVVCCNPSHRYDFESAIAVHLVLGATWARIVWTDPDNRDALWISRNDSGHWVTSRLWIGAAYTPSIANLGRGIAVAFRDGNYRLRYLTWDPVSGPTRPIVVAHQCCAGLALALHNGHPAIALATIQHALKFWQPGTLVSVDNSASNPSLTFDNHGRPAIAYGGDGVWFARRSSSGWSTRRVMGLAYDQPSITIDGSGEIALVAAGATSSKTWIAFKRLDVASNTLTLMQAPYDTVGGEPTYWDQPHVTLVSGRAVAVAYYAGSPGSAGGGFAGPYVTRQQ